MILSNLLNPWKRAAALERENQRLRDCLEHEEQRNFDYMFNRMAHERSKLAQIEAMNAHLMQASLDIANLSTHPLIFAMQEAKP